ncbi:MAG: cytochrome c3 family protein [Nitrospirae bacterium]|nr:cytochrome c3 family protein [Nitrospirota bacterium]
MRWLILVVIFGSLVISCSPKVEKGKAEETQEKIISKDEAVGSLPCFKCHSYQRFSASPQKGVFSHQIHTNTGYHCNQCHDFEGHKYMTINKNICGNCHNIKSVAFKKTGLPSRFNHETHSKMFGCRECHPKIFLMKAGTADVTMKDINKGLYCGACHNGKRAFASSECTKCHEMKTFDKELTYKVEGLGPVVFSHKFHTSAFSCADCHPKLFAMKKTQGRMPMDKINEGKYCGACHNGNIASPASDCMKCHKG